MTVQLVQSIKDAEGQADAMLREARQLARQIGKEAEGKAAKLLDEAVAQAEAKAKEMVLQAEREAREEANPMVAAKQQENARIGSTAQKRLPQAVAMITERIVKVHADH